MLFGTGCLIGCPDIESGPVSGMPRGLGQLQCERWKGSLIWGVARPVVVGCGSEKSFCDGLHQYLLSFLWCIRLYLTSQIFMMEGMQIFAVCGVVWFGELADAPQEFCIISWPRRSFDSLYIR